MFSHLSNVIPLLLAYDIHLHTKAFTVYYYYLLLTHLPLEKHNRGARNQKIDWLLVSKENNIFRTKILSNVMLVQCSLWRISPIKFKKKMMLNIDLITELPRFRNCLSSQNTSLCEENKYSAKHLFVGNIQVDSSVSLILGTSLEEQPPTHKG